MEPILILIMYVKIVRRHVQSVLIHKIVPPVSVEHGYILKIVMPPVLTNFSTHQMEPANHVFHLAINAKPLRYVLAVE
jgi:hypothetical protein